eukprot:TRINITY_DN5060_c0_g1_i3.p1 TRINITY_DN5060_c0_g1~~TRINITY_DN5060_c0_g1_i3.p1  ORF type:complete len:132 (-),score=24.00 TRINITY_DN5060_c0_g1_i3:145-540(-)
MLMLECLRVTFLVEIPSLVYCYPSHPMHKPRKTETSRKERKRISAPHPEPYKKLLQDLWSDLLPRDRRDRAKEGRRGSRDGDRTACDEEEEDGGDGGGGGEEKTQGSQQKDGGRAETDGSVWRGRRKEAAK